MKLSRHWLQQYVDLNDLSDDRIREALTLIGFEVEDVETTGLDPVEHLVVGEVLEKNPHPNADRLSLCSVDVGDGTPRSIVCGARNFDVGDRVPVALVGAVLPGDFKIKKSKLRGVASEGMLCAAGELGLGEDHSGLMILTDNPAATIGRPVHEVFSTRDTVFDVEVTPNRPDCLSHVGMARELAAYFNRGLDYPEVTSSASDPFRQQGEPLLRELKVEAGEACPLYHAYSIRGVKIAPSPDWLRQALTAIGLRPINNVVDVTNYVLMELGQPLHAFDAAKIGGDTILVRKAREGEALTTLDDRRRELNNRMTVIADAERPMVIAGVMGSVDAEVDGATVNVVLEVAFFNPAEIRATSRRLNLSTDSSYRFERGVDPENLEYAALRAIDLILQTAGGSLQGPPQTVGHPPEVEREIRLAPDFVRERLGFGPDNEAIRDVFERLGLNVRVHTQDAGREIWIVSIPSFRSDLERPVDLVEEFLRIYGTDNVPDAPVVSQVIPAEDNPVSVFNDRAAEVLVGHGFIECMHYSLRAEAETRAWYGHALADTLGLANPLTADQSHLRPSLLPGLMDALRYNLSRGNMTPRLFERGRVFREVSGKVWELVSLAFLIHIPDESPSWKEREPPDYYSARVVLDDIFRAAGIDPEQQKTIPIRDEDTWLDGHAGRIGTFSEDHYEAKVGLMDFGRLKDWAIAGTVLAGGILVKPDFLEKRERSFVYRPVSTYPATVRDLALVVDADALAETVRRDLMAAAQAAAGDQFDVERVSVFDIYTGPGLPEGKKSLAFSISFRSDERTLKDKEVNRAFDQLQAAIAESGVYSVRS
ncbi:MAG: phenylalanine--tRNA ligase subunit beta [Opitutales bacterium]